MPLIRGIVARRRGQPAAEARDLFDMMAAADGTGDEALLCDEVATTIVAGHETTALPLFWATLLLARSPRWGRPGPSRAAASRVGRWGHWRRTWNVRTRWPGSRR